MSRSRYDDLHDQFYAILTTKKGTRYERLAAIVFKILDDSNTVIHDLKLAGESEVKHQIDVTVERDGKRHRVLVECKDFDVAGDKVGLGIVRDFFAVAEDTKPDEAVILTCNDFTGEAAKYARAKGIKLARLRLFEDADWEGRLRRILLHLRVTSREDVSVTVKAGSERSLNRLTADLAAAGLSAITASRQDPTIVVENGIRTQINDYVEPRLNAYVPTREGPVRLELAAPSLALEVAGREPVPIQALYVNFTVRAEERVIASVADGVATLLVQGLGADLIVYDGDLRRFKIDGETGEVVPV